MKRVVITGATGFIGANLTRRLLSQGHEVHLLVRPNHSVWRIADIVNNVQMHEVILTDHSAVSEIIKKIQPEWCFHLAVFGAYSWQTDWRQMVDTNIIGTINLMEACQAEGVEAFVNTGSSSEYGRKLSAPAESELVDPYSYYAVTKVAATLFGTHFARNLGIPLVTIRLYSVYGAFEEPARLIPTLIIHGFANKLPPLVNPDIAHDYIFIEDVCHAYILAALNATRFPGEVFNLGTGIQTSIREIVAIACKIQKTTAVPLWGSMPNRKWDSSVWVADCRKIKTLLGWQPSVSIESGLEATIQWFLHNPELLKMYQNKVLQP